MPYNRIEEIERIIPNKNIRDLIFNYDGELCSFLTDDEYCLTYFSNALIVSSLIVMNAFYNWKRQFNQINGKDKKDAIFAFSNSMIRIYSMLDNAYDSVKIDSDFVYNLINNLHIDYELKTVGANSFLDTVGIRSFFKFGNDKLTKYILMLKQKRMSSRMSPKFGFVELCECLEMFPFLSKADAVLTENPAKKGLFGVEINFDERYYSLKNINLNYSIFSYYDSVYYMEDLQMIDNRKFDDKFEKNQVLLLNFLSLDKADQFRMVLLDEKMKQYENEEIVIVNDTEIENFLIDYDIISFTTKGESYFFKDYIFINNKYIQYLSLTIADTISVKTKNAIKNKYGSKYKTIFDKMYVASLYNNCDEIIGYRWDEIIMFLLLEEGIYSCLQFLLITEKYDAFLNSFFLRFGTIVSKLTAENEFLNNPTYNLQYKNAKAEINMQTQALILLATKLLTINELDISQNYNPTTIVDIISDLKKTNSSNNRALVEKNAYFVSSLINTILFIDTFYEGIFEFARHRKFKELVFEESSFSNYQDYKEAKEHCLVEMQRKIKELKVFNGHFGTLLQFKGSPSQYYDLARKKVDEAFSQLINRNEQYSRRNSVDNEILFDTLGRRTLFDSKDISDLQKNIIKQISLLQNNDIAKNSDELYNSIVDCLSFLKEGNLDESHNTSNILFPVIGHYSNGVTSRDGYKYSYFHVDYYETLDNQTQIKMITDENFEFNEAYFCVPNINRVAKINKDGCAFDHIWISPIIIPCTIFSPQVNASFSRLDDEKDFDKAIELLYNVDTRIWGNLFGDIETAKKVMPLLFNNTKSVFYKNYYHILKINNEIVSIASLYGLNAMPKWDTDLFEMAFGECNIEIQDKTRIAYAYFKDTFNDFIGKDFTQICDLCVKEEYRNKGIGKAILKYLVKKSELEGKNTLITVYGDNTVAYNLYFSLGFVPYSSNYDTRGTDTADQKYYRMLKSI